MFGARLAELEALAREQGLDFFPTSFEVVPQDVMMEMAAYGLPTRARHWSYGKVYQSQRLYGSMGLSKIYEIVLNNNPSLAFLLDTNTEIANLLVTAHVFAHVDFFTHNVLFANTNRNMINDAMAHALRIDGYIERYGLETVEHLMDIGFALDRHIDPHKGLERQPYPKRHVVEKERPTLPYEDLFNTTTPSVIYEVEGDKLPPYPERDLLWFLCTNAPLDPWQCDVLQIIRVVCSSRRTVCCFTAIAASPSSGRLPTVSTARLFLQHQSNHLCRQILCQYTRTLPCERDN